MSLAFFAFCFWVAAVVGTGFLEPYRRARAQLALLALAVPIVLMALISQGWFPALFATLGVVAMLPGLIARLWRLGATVLKLRFKAMRGDAAGA